jgi:ABC-type antimicrobial peptide transport system ATPase subunit
MSEAKIRGVRGNRIGMIFQEPMSSLNPLHTIEKQINEVLFVHQGLGRKQARERTLELLEMVEIQNLKKIRNIAKEDADLTKSRLEATKVWLNLLKQSEPVDEGQLHRVLLESVRLSKKTLMTLLTQGEERERLGVGRGYI